MVRNKNIWPLLIILILTLVFFHKVLLNPDKLISPGYDLTLAYTPWKFFSHQSYQEYGKLPLWNPNLFSGTPFLGDLSVSMFYYPFNWFFVVFNPEIVYGFLFMIHVLIAGVSTYFFLRNKRISEYSSLIGAVSFMFSAVLISRIFVGHMTNMFVICWVPLLFLFCDRLIKHKKLNDALWLGIILALQLNASMIQNFFYSCVALSLYFGLNWLRSKKKPKLAFYYVTAFVICVGLSAVILLPAIEYAQHTTRTAGRSYEFSSFGSYAPWRLINFVLPNIYGTPVNNTDWVGGFYWEYAAYLGVLGLLLARISLLNNRKEKSDFVILFLFGLLVAFGSYTPFFRLIYNIPGFSLFRTPAAIMFVPVFALVVLAGYGCDILLKKDFKSVGKILVLIGLIALFLVPVIYSQKDLIVNKGELMLNQSGILENENAKSFDYYQGKLIQIHNGIINSALRIGLLLTAIGMVIYFKSNTNLKLVKFLLLAILIFDLFSYGLPMIYVKDVSEVFMQDELVEFLKQDTGQFRVLDTSGYLRHSVAARHNIELATGYNPLILKEYVELANLISGDEEYAPTELMLQLDPKFSLEKIKNHEVIDLLNVKYVVSHTKSNVSGYKLVYENLEYEQVRHYGGKEFVMETNKVFVYENVDVLPRVFVSDYKSGVVEITKYSPNQIMLNAELKEQDFVVLSEVYYPGWKAYDNGKPIDIQKTNQALRGIQLEKGDHVIDFVYEPISYRIGKVISILSVLVLLVILFKLNKKNIFYRFL